MVDFKRLLAASQERKNAEAETPVAAAVAGQASPSQPQESPPAAAPKNPFAKRVHAGGGAPDGSIQWELADAGAGNVLEGVQPVREEAPVVTDSEQAPLTPGTPAPKLAGIKFASTPASKVPASTPKKIESLDDMDNIDLSGIELLDDEPAGPRSSFADETPATKPTRELPENLTKQAKDFIGLIDGVYEMLHDPQFLGQVIRNIMIELKDNPQYIKHICDEDVRVWIRTMRDSMGLARIKKIESKAKRGSGTGARTSKSKVDDDIMSDLDSMLGDLG